jgi:hypothetical protein
VSRCQKVSTTAMMSSLIHSQVACRNLAVNLSGPDALSGGSALTTAHTSTSVNRSPKLTGSMVGKLSRSRFITLKRLGEVPSLALLRSQQFTIH